MLRGDRLIDVVEFYEVSMALGRDPISLFGDFVIRTNAKRVIVAEVKTTVRATDGSSRVADQALKLDRIKTDEQ